MDIVLMVLGATALFLGLLWVKPHPRKIRGIGLHRKEDGSEFSSWIRFKPNPGFKLLGHQWSWHWGKEGRLRPLGRKKLRALKRARKRGEL